MAAHKLITRSFTSGTQNSMKRLTSKYITLAYLTLGITVPFALPLKTTLESHNEQRR